MKKIGIILVLLLLAGCLGGSETYQTYTIKGIVYHGDTSISLANAEVTIKVGSNSYYPVVQHNGEFIQTLNTRLETGSITISGKGYQTLRAKLQLKSFIGPYEPIHFSLEPNPEHMDHTLVSGWIDFALPMVTSTSRSRITQLAFDPIIDVLEAETQELIIYPFEYSQATANELYQEFQAIDMRLRPEIGIIILKFPMDYDLELTLQNISFHPKVLEAYINYPVFALEMTPTPNDPLYHQQWNLPVTYLPHAWAITTGDKSIRIAVLDSKVYSHEDLLYNLGNGYDCTEAKVIKALENREETLISHGTHVAGIIGAVTNNEIGVAGTMWDVEIIPIQVLNDGGKGSLDALIAGIYQAIELDVDIINLSLGIDKHSELLYEAIVDAYNQGIIMVAAAGNKSVNMKYPAQYQEVIAVGATSPIHEIPWYSAYEGVKLFAPGGDGFSGIDNYKNQILSTDIKSFNTPSQYDYKYAAGTSMAAPHVSGIVGLIFSYHGSNYTTEAIFDLLWQTGTTFDLNNPEQRLVNAYAAITESYIQKTSIEFMNINSGKSYFLTDIDNLRHFYQLLPPDEYLVKAHLDVDGNSILNSGDWYVEQGLSVAKDGHITDFVMRMEIY